MLYMRVLSVLMLITATASADNPPFKFKTKRDDDQVAVKVEKDRTVFDVTCPTGISELVIERTGKAWPEVVVVRLRLSGLEHFKATGGKVTLGVGTLNYKGERPTGLWASDTKESPDDPKSVYFMDFKMIDKNGKPTKEIPLQSGYFEMRLPKPFFEGNPKSVTLEWVDFYRR